MYPLTRLYGGLMSTAALRNSKVAISCFGPLEPLVSKGFQSDLQPSILRKKLAVVGEICTEKPFTRLETLRSRKLGFDSHLFIMPPSRQG